MQQDISYVQVTNDRLLYGDDGMVVPSWAPGCPWTGCPDGRAFRSALRLHPNINTLFLQNGCVAPSVRSSPADLAACLGFFNGMLSNGVEGIFQQLLVITQQLVTERSAYGVAMAGDKALLAACVQSNLRNSADPRIVLIQQFVETYMAPAYSFNSDTYKVRPGGVPG